MPLHMGSTGKAPSDLEVVSKLGASIFKISRNSALSQAEAKLEI